MLKILLVAIILLGPEEISNLRKMITAFDKEVVFEYVKQNARKENAGE